MKRRPLLVLIGALIVAGGVFLFSQETTVLTLTNLDHPRTLSFSVRPGERFLMFYMHSIYDQPVTEEFEVQRNEVILRGIRTSHAGVMEYYGLEDEAGFHGMNKTVGPAFIIQMAMDPRQGLILQGRKIRLRNMGEGGDRIEVRASTASMARQWVRGLRVQWKKLVGERT